jgi:hypothetical protein
MRLAISRDCTGEPPGELTTMAMAGADLGERALQQRADGGDVKAPGTVLGGDDAVQTHDRDRGAAAAEQSLQPAHCISLTRHKRLCHQT